jgi:hypothetical protein
MTLDLNNHLLQAPNGLFAALLGHLVLQITLGASPVVASLVLLVIWDVP